MIPSSVSARSIRALTHAQDPGAVNWCRPADDEQLTVVVNTTDWLAARDWLGLVSRVCSIHGENGVNDFFFFSRQRYFRYVSKPEGGGAKGGAQAPCCFGDKMLCSLRQSVS